MCVRLPPRGNTWETVLFNMTLVFYTNVFKRAKGGCLCVVPVLGLWPCACRVKFEPDQSSLLPLQ